MPAVPEWCPTPCSTGAAHEPPADPVCRRPAVPARRRGCRTHHPGQSRDRGHPRDPGGTHRAHAPLPEHAPGDARRLDRRGAPHDFHALRQCGPAARCRAADGRAAADHVLRRADRRRRMVADRRTQGHRVSPRRRRQRELPDRVPGSRGRGAGPPDRRPRPRRRPGLVPGRHQDRVLLDCAQRHECGHLYRRSARPARARAGVRGRRARLGRRRVVAGWQVAADRALRLRQRDLRIRLRPGKPQAEGNRAVDGQGCALQCGLRPRRRRRLLHLRRRQRVPDAAPLRLRDRQGHAVDRWRALGRGGSRDLARRALPRLGRERGRREPVEAARPAKRRRSRAAGAAVRRHRQHRIRARRAPPRVQPADARGPI